MVILHSTIGPQTPINGKSSCENSCCWAQIQTEEEPKLICVHFNLVLENIVKLTLLKAYQAAIANPTISEQMIHRETVITQFFLKSTAF